VLVTALREPRLVPTLLVICNRPALPFDGQGNGHPSWLPEIDAIDLRASDTLRKEIGGGLEHHDALAVVDRGVRAVEGPVGELGADAGVAVDQHQLPRSDATDLRVVGDGDGVVTVAGRRLSSAALW